MTRLCSTDGCTKKHLARGWCSTHYNQNRYTPEQRHPKVTLPCGNCGAPCVKDKGSTKKFASSFCSLACRDVVHGPARAERARDPEFLAKWHSPEARAKAAATRNSLRSRVIRALRNTQKRTHGTTWVTGTCHRCGGPFVSALVKDIGKYCSSRCKRAASQSRRRARERGAVSEIYSRHAVFARDGWRCHLCGCVTDRGALVPAPHAPTIDHVVPLARGGADTLANVATACFICNSTKRDIMPAPNPAPTTRTLVRTG